MSEEPPGWIGRRVARVEDARLLTGRGHFIDDHPPIGDIHAPAIVRSPHAHARITGYDVSTALRMEGVVGVVTGEDVARFTRHFPVGVPAPVRYHCAATDKVRFVGEPVAVVVARSRYLAEDAADAVGVEYEPLPAVVDVERALEPDAPAGFTVILPESRPGSADSRSAEAAQETAEEQLEELREADLEVDVSDEEEVEVEVEGGAVQARSGPARLLAVDDDFDILRMLDRTLKSAGYVVDLARDGREAEQKLKSEKHDLVVLDAMLPHVHGFEICARLKASPRTRKMPVILVSAVYRGWRYAHDARETFGADDYLEKPFHLPELLRRVEAWISGGTVAASTEKADKLYQEGIALLEDKKPAEAREVLENAVKEDPFSPRAHFALGRAMHEQGDLFHAITAYERAVELRPNLFHALRALAALYEQKGFRRKAVEAVERAVHAAPDPKTRDTMRQRLLKLL